MTRGPPPCDEQGRVQRVARFATDLTEAERAVEHERMLLAELQHRVRNTLAVVRSVARLLALPPLGPPRSGKVADGVGFEPTEGVNPRRFSRPLP